MFYTRDMFDFGKDEDTIHIIFSDQKEIKRTTVSKKYLTKIKNIYDLQKELRHIKTVMSKRNQLPLDEIIKILHSHQVFPWSFDAAQLQDEHTAARNKVINDIMRDIRKLTKQTRMEI
jgi:hypothetical protein